MLSGFKLNITEKEFFMDASKQQQTQLECRRKKNQIENFQAKWKKPDKKEEKKNYDVKCKKEAFPFLFWIKDKETELNAAWIFNSLKST